MPYRASTLHGPAGAAMGKRKERKAEGDQVEAHDEKTGCHSKFNRSRPILDRTLSSIS